MVESAEITLAKHGERLDTIDKRLDKIENIAESLNQVNVSLEKLNMSVSGIVEAQKKQATDIENLKLAPGKTAKDFWITVGKEALKAVVVAIITALLVLVIKK